MQQRALQLSEGPVHDVVTEIRGPNYDRLEGVRQGKKRSNKRQQMESFSVPCSSFLSGLLSDSRSRIATDSLPSSPLLLGYRFTRSSNPFVLPPACQQTHVTHGQGHERQTWRRESCIVNLHAVNKSPICLRVIRVLGVVSLWSCKSLLSQTKLFTRNTGVSTTGKRQMERVTSAFK